MADIALTKLSGGITDYIYNADPSKFEIAENVLPKPTDGLLTRDGSIVYPSSVKQTTRIDSTFYFNGTRFVQVGNKIFTSDSTTSLKMGSKLDTTNLITNGNFASGNTGWTGLPGEGWDATSGVCVHTAGTAGSNGFYQEISMTAGKRYQLVFTESSLSAGYDYAMDVNANSNTGTAVIIGGEVNKFSISTTSTTAYFYGNLTHYAIIECTGTGLVQINFGQNLASAFNGSIDNITLYEILNDTKELLPGATSPYIDIARSYDECIISNTDVTVTPQTKIWYDSHISSTLKKSTVGLPKPASLTTNGGTGGSKSVYYAVCYRYNYITGSNTEKADISEPFYSTQYKLTNSVSVSNPITVTLPTLSNTSTTGWDVKNIILEIYRTKENGELFYFVGNVINGQTSFLDIVSDTVAGGAWYLSEIAYFSTTDLLNNNPPKSKYVSISNEIAYYANCQSTAILYDRFGRTRKTSQYREKNAVYQSIPGDLDSVPGDFYAKVGDEIMGIECLSFPVVFTKTLIARLEGNFDGEGGGFIVPKTIDPYAGCLGHQSIVASKDAIFWAGNTGFFMTNGYQVQKLPINSPESLNITYKTFLNSTLNTNKEDRISATYDFRFNRIYWTVNISSSASVDNTLIIVYDIGKDSFWFLKGDTISSSPFAPTAIDYSFDGLVRGTKDGYLFQHGSSYTTDATYASSTWGTTAISSKIKHVGFDMGDATNQKYVNDVTINAINHGDITMTLKTYPDGIATGNSLDDIVFVASGLDSKKILETRRNSTNQLRCNHIQLEVATAAGVLDIDAIGFNAELIGKENTYKK